MRKVLYLAFFVITAISSAVAADNVVDLSGQWQFAIDASDEGINGNWSEKTLDDAISLPGTMDMSGKGDANTLEPKLEKPQMLHLTRKHSYVGAAWYSREIEIPESWSGKQMELMLERVMWKSMVWIDGKKLGTECESLTTPHRYLLPAGIKPGKHNLTIRIDNRKQHDISVRDLAHAYTNDSQTMWNGILGRIELRALPEVYLSDLQLYPDVDRKVVKCVASVMNTTKKSIKGTLQLQCAKEKGVSSFAPNSVKSTFKPGVTVVEHECAMGDEVSLWSEFSPECYIMQASLVAGTGADVKSARFGMRNISTSGCAMLNNGKRIFLRGTLECCVFPLTGVPPTDKKGWRKVFSSAKAYGLNHLRFHSWCPPAAAFEVADEMGFYVQVELPLWSLTVGKDEPTNQFLYAEADNILKEYGNHPSFCLMSVGNELQPDFVFLNALRSYMQNKDNRRLYTATSFTFEKGHGDWPEQGDDYYITQWTKKGWVRGQGVFNGEAPSFDKDFSKSIEGLQVPMVSHEIGQYAVYPNMKEIDKYTGTLDPLNFKAVRNDLIAKGLYDRADDYLIASGKLAELLYKEEIERAMKTPGFSGFQLLGINDFPGQGTALVGLLDAFWDSKGIVSADEFSRYCAPVVPLVRFPKAVYASGEIFEALVEVANYSDADISNGDVEWSLVDTSNRNEVASGRFSVANIASGGNSTVGKVYVPLNGIADAMNLKLDVRVAHTPYRNDWNVWVYPRRQKVDSGDVVLTDNLSTALAELAKGRKVLLSPQTGAINGIEGKFVPVFWSPIHFPKQAGSMGLLCEASHPALAAFPNDGHTDWQWWNLLKHSRTMVVDSISGITPIVEQVDNFANNRQLVSVFEASCNGGQLLFSSMDILSDENLKNPEVMQFLHSVVSYMNSSSFAPKTTLEASSLRLLVNDTADEVKQSSATSIY